MCSNSTTYVTNKLNLVTYRTLIYLQLITYILAPKDVEINPCLPSPCGPNSLCQIINKTPACTCLANFIGSPPNCRPECTINAECSGHLTCINSKCRDPCPGSCGLNTRCNTINHTPMCSCLEGYTGNPFLACSIIVHGVYFILLKKYVFVFR